ARRAQLQQQDALATGRAGLRVIAGRDAAQAAAAGQTMVAKIIVQRHGLIPGKQCRGSLLEPAAVMVQDKVQRVPGRPNRAAWFRAPCGRMSVSKMPVGRARDAELLGRSTTPP